MKRIMYIRSGPYEPDITSYNMQEVGMLSEFCKKGYDCDLFYYGKKERIEKIDFEGKAGQLTIHYIKGIRLFRSGLYTKLLNKSFLGKYDAIITSEYSQIMTVLLCRIHPNVYCFNGPYYNLFKLPFIEPVYDFLFLNTLRKNIKQFFCKSNLAEMYLNNKGLLQTTTVGVGQNFMKFQEVKKPSEQTLELLNFMRRHRVMLIVGSIDDRKNFPFVLELFSKIYRINPNFRLMVVGTGREEYIQKELLKVDCGLKEKILFVGKLANTELQFIYPESFVFIMPSKLEIFGMVLLEAMSFGGVVISSFNGGSSVLIKDGDNGYIRSIDDVKLWSNLILSKEFETNREAISRSAIETVKHDFTWKVIVQKMIENGEK